MVEIELSQRDIEFVNRQAELTYVCVAKKRGVSPEIVHTLPYCRDMTNDLGPRLVIRWPEIRIQNNFDPEAGFGEVASYGHSFLKLGKDWVIDPGWQLFRDQRNVLKRLKERLFPPPKVLIVREQELLRTLGKLGVNTYRCAPNWKL